MKGVRVLTILLCLLLGLAPCAQAISVDDAMELYSGMIGHIAFSLPNSPHRMIEADYQGLWTNGIQLAGFCESQDELKSGGEFQFRTADISQWIDGITAANPDLGAYKTKANALLQYATFMIRNFGGEPADMKAKEDGEFVIAVFTYTYPDAPGARYEGRALLEGGTAVYLIGETCTELSRALECLRIVSDDEMRAYNAREPETRTMGALTATFPTPVTVFRDDSAEYFMCFARDYSQLVVRHIPLTGALDPDQAALKESLLAIAKKIVLPAVSGETVYDAELSMPASDMACLTFTTVNTTLYGEEFGQRFLCRLYMGDRGIYVVIAADSETGVAFMDSLVLKAE